MKTDSASSITCQLFIPAKYYAELKEDTKELFKEASPGYYFSEFPAEVEDSSFLGEFLTAFCEVALIMGNPKYEYTEECELHSELLKLGTDEKSFNLLVTIQYPGTDSSFHDILIFKEKEQSLGFYSFELLGDQTIFSAD